MSATEILRLSEKSALKGGQIVSRVKGKASNSKNKSKLKSFGAVGFITFMLVGFLMIFGSGNIIPSAISERLVEETDVQYADAVESKKIVFQQALYSGEIPEDTAQNLKNEGVLVGYMDGDNFVESNKANGELVLKIDNRIITADNFIKEVNSNIKLYNAFNNATYSRAAYYYDDAAKEVFRKIGTGRNNYDESSDFDKVMNDMVGEGSNVNINSVSLVAKTRKNEQTGREEVYYEYEENGASANSATDVDLFLETTREKNPAASANESALNTADALKVADTMSKEQRSSLFFLTFMENISKMKAGEGNQSKINEAMNYLYNNAETQIVDIDTGEIVTTPGTALESPSLYAVLAGEKVNPKKVENYSSDRILKTIENRVGSDGTASINGTVASSYKKISGSVGRFINNGTETASSEVIDLVKPTVSSSLMDNSYDTIKGVNAGEFLVEGAVNVGKELAKASGATAGDVDAAVKYARLNSEVLAMDAKLDRINRSPLDITSKNTFLGSIVYKIAIVTAKISGPPLSNVTMFGNLVSTSISSLLPSSFADETSGYLSSFGDCETYATIGAVGSAQCAEIATFDTSTLDDPFNNSGFIAFVEANTTLDSSGVRTINPGSVLAKFILCNNERVTPLGVVDGGILDSLNNESSSIPFVTNILSMIKTYLGTSEADKRIATGAAFVNSVNNPDWQTYKYAQRYVSLARATTTLKQYSSDTTAYNNIRFFEGNENPVVAFLKEYYAFNN